MSVCLSVCLSVCFVGLSVCLSGTGDTSICLSKAALIIRHTAYLIHTVLTLQPVLVDKAGLDGSLSLLFSFSFFCHSSPGMQSPSISTTLLHSLPSAIQTCPVLPTVSVHNLISTFYLPLLDIHSLCKPFPVLL